MLRIYFHRIPYFYAMIKLFLFIFFLSSLCCSCITKMQKTLYRRTHPVSLYRLSWLQGNWQGSGGTQPFYEIYKIQNDSTLEITSYNWNGRDSSNTVKTFLRKYGDDYYLGRERNWKVFAFTDSMIIMKPVYKAAIGILWRARSENTWQAVIRTARDEKLYTMTRIKHFSAK